MNIGVNWEERGREGDGGGSRTCSGQFLRKYLGRLCAAGAAESKGTGARQMKA